MARLVFPFVRSFLLTAPIFLLTQNLSPGTLNPKNRVLREENILDCFCHQHGEFWGERSLGGKAVWP
jgi:hypothetical protein